MKLEHSNWDSEGQPIVSVRSQSSLLAEQDRS
jgi:hypothetical protein